MWARRLQLGCAGHGRVSMPGQRALLLAFLGSWLPLLEGARILTVALYGECLSALLGAGHRGPLLPRAVRSAAESGPYLGKHGVSLKLRASWEDRSAPT